MTRETCEQTSNLDLSSLMNDTRLYLESKPAGEEFDLIADGVDISNMQLLLKPTKEFGNDEPADPGSSRWRLPATRSLQTASGASSPRPVHPRSRFNIGEIAS